MKYKRPKQAVILAGGKGSRLRPITNEIPKPMIIFNGKPFLEYLIEMIRDQGFDRILLLLGYMPESIQDYFGNGNKWGVEIRYSVTDVEDLTGRRIKSADHFLDNVFLLMYCDNYWPMQFDRMWQEYVSADVKALITVYENIDKYSKDNLRVDKNGYVEKYDKSRTAPDLHGVDIGFVILQKDVLNLLPDQNVSFEENIYNELIRQRQLMAYMTKHRYYSIGSHDRLHLTRDFLLRRPTIILDRDGVLNKKPPKAHYVLSWDDWEWIPGAIEAICLLKKAGYRIIIVSNQAGIAREFMTESDLDAIHKNMLEDLSKHGGSIDKIYFCPHGWDENCECRKPKPGLLFNAQREFNLDLSRTFFIGDDERDLQAGVAADCRTVLIDKNNSFLKITKEMILK